jgi:hypothetical protein
MTDQQQLDDPQSRIDRVKIGRKETVTKLATVDDLIVYVTENNGLILEFVRYGADDRSVESYRVAACPEDAKRIRGAAR